MYTSHVVIINTLASGDMPLILNIPPKWGSGNITASHSAGLGLTCGQVIFLVEVLAKFLNYWHRDGNLDPGFKSYVLES